MASTNPFRGMPPHVVRELMRHVSAKPLPKHSDMIQQVHDEQKQRMRKVLYGCIAFTSIAASIPLLAHWWIGGLNEKENGLTAAQNRRGAFLNSGSKDVGKDPNWDFTKGEYKKDAGYWALFNEEKLPPEFHGMSDDQYQKHKADIEAFARDRPHVGKANFFLKKIHTQKCFLIIII